MITEAEYDMLAPFQVEDYWHISVAEVDELRAVIDDAEDERPIQRHLSANPRLLATMLGGGHGRWVRSQVRLGSQYVPDFVIGEGDSSGIWWTLVELESPRKPVFIQSGELADRTRHGIDQVQSWRHWLRENGDYARKSPASGGLGLPYINDAAVGWVVIGRRTDLTDEEVWRRRQVLEQQRVAIHTYDWLVDVIWARKWRQPYPEDSV